MSMIQDPALHRLRHQLRGHVYDPGEPEYDEARTLFNARIDRRPRHIVRCSTPTQVAAALDYARRRDLPVAVRAGGHSVAGLSLVDDGIVIDLRGMREITVDADRRVVRAGAGLTWGELDAATQAHGLATVGGRVSSTGVTGLALGGGSGWLERKHGLSSDNILAAELVTAGGEQVRATAEEHPELFWALRGGGGNFGVVTALEFALHPVGPRCSPASCCTRPSAAAS
jgi:FAD/FMN-containing dehydrogenase